MKKHILLVIVTIMICFSVLAGCMNDPSGNKDVEHAGNAENTFDFGGIELCNGSVALNLDPDAKENQLTEDFLRTNTKQITVSAETVPGSATIDVFLYSAESADEPIAFATISSSSKRAVFENLTFSAAYKVGAAMSGTSDTVSLTISD